MTWLQSGQSRSFGMAPAWRTERAIDLDEPVQSVTAGEAAAIPHSTT